jgi:hypothetical protein
MVSYCSLHCRIKGAEKTGPVLLGQRSGSAGIRSQLPQVPGYLTTGKRVSYIRLRPLFASRGDDPREFLEQRDASGISAVTHTSTAETCSAIQSSAAFCSVADEDHAHVRGAWWPDRSGAIGDNENVKSKASR